MSGWRGRNIVILGIDLRHLNYPLAVARRTVGRRLHIFLFGDLRTFTRRRLVAHLGDIFGEAQIWRRVAMAIQTPTHRERFGLINFDHLVDATVARFTANAGTNVGRMVEVHVVREVGHPRPPHGLAAGEGLADRQQLRAFGMNRRMAIHARCRGWHGRFSAAFHGSVAVTTVHTKFASVQGMAVWHGLIGLVAEANRFRRYAVADKRH